MAAMADSGPKACFFQQPGPAEQKGLKPGLEQQKKCCQKTSQPENDYGIIRFAPFIIKNSQSLFPFLF
jgi:hypothetical protein